MSLATKRRLAAANGTHQGATKPVEPPPPLIGDWRDDVPVMPNGKPYAPELLVESLAGLTPQPVHWLVPNRIPAGMMGLIAGEGGHGKSMTTLNLVSPITSGRCAFGLTYPNPVSGKALLISCEDDWERTIVPRLAALGADLSKVLRVKGVRMKADGQTLDFHLGHFRELESLLTANPDIRLVVIDPAGAYVGRAGVNENRDADLRAVLGPLSEAANHTGATVILVKHLNKSAGVSAVQRVSGSTGYVNAVRFAYMILPDPDDRELKLMLPIKANVLPAGQTGLAYRLESIPPEEARAVLLSRWPDLAAADLDALAEQLFRQRWEEGSTIDADHAIGRKTERKDEPNKVAKCAEFTREFLRQYAYPSNEILDAAKKAGFTFDNVAKAKTVLKESGLRNSNLGRLRGEWWSGFGRPDDWTLRPDPSFHESPNSHNSHKSPNSHNISNTGGFQCKETNETCETSETQETGDHDEHAAERDAIAEFGGG
jgi:hypothetical protein